jgi:hypothetical protein
MRMMRSITIMLAAVAAVGVMTSCSSKKPVTSATPGHPEFAVGVTLLTEEHPFYR